MEKNFNYKKLCPFKWFVLQNFPFIEADFDAITNWQLFCKLGEEMNKIINSTNILGTQVENLTEYVSNYFDNLDVQDEINAKLDEMAEGGQLQEIISQYINLNAIITFSNVEELKASENLVAGSVAQTLGYYNIGDGGNAQYYIVDDNSLNTDDSFVIQLDNGLKAVLQYNEKVSILQLGGRRQKNNIRYDIHDYIVKYITKNENSKIPFTLFLPAGIYYTTPVEIVSTEYNIQGQCERTGVVNGGSSKPTILSAYTNQEYVLKLGNATRGSGYGTIENIMFSTCVFDDNTARISYNEVSNACLVLNWVYFMRSKWLTFNYIKGTALKISTCWELMFDFLDFNHVDAHENGIFVFDELITTVPNGNISDSNFNYLRFEQIIGKCIVMKNNCRVLDVRFGTINVEPSVITDMDYEWAQYDSALDYNVTPVFDINGQCVFLVDNIQINNFYLRYMTVNGINYIVGDLIHLTNENLLYGIIINSINLWFANNNVCLLKTIGNAYDNWKSKIVVNNVLNDSQFDLLCDVKNVARIELKSPICGSQRDIQYITQYGSRIPCFRNIYNNQYQNQGLIHYNPESVNPEHLTIKNTGALTSIGKRLFGFIYNSDLLKLRAKIAENQNMVVRVYCYRVDTGTYVSMTQDVTLVGTGSFKDYDIELTNPTYAFHGSTCFIQIVNNNDTTEFELDNFSN